MKAVFKKVIYDEIDIDFQKIYDLIIQKTGKDDFNTLYDEFADNAKYYISETQAIESLFNDYGLMVSFRDNEDTIKSKYDYNRYVFKYISLFTLKKLEIIVETNFYSPVYPTCNHKINCFITDSSNLIKDSK